MKRLSFGIKEYITKLGGDDSLARKAHRAAQVRSMWAECVDEIFLDHTNSVYIIKENEEKILIVYVDESIFAAELNARRELIKLKFLQSFGEDISEFRILISRGAYKRNYPYKTSEGSSSKKTTERKLSSEEKHQINEIVSLIEDKKLQESLRNAMIADWKWKKPDTQ